MTSILASSAACQYGRGPCHLPHTGLQLEHIGGLAVVILLVGITLIAVGYRWRRR